MPILVLLGLGGPVLSCGGDGVVEPHIQSTEALTETAAARKGDKPTLDHATLNIDDMLADPLFQALVQGIEPPGLAEPVLAAVDALAAGQTGKATSLIAKASDEAVALEDEATAAEALIYWSAIERYFEEAELI